MDFTACNILLLLGITHRFLIFLHPPNQNPSKQIYYLICRLSHPVLINECAIYSNVHHLSHSVTESTTKLK